jgi:peptidyl-tRNA hydrolase, PTH1 family
MTSNSVIKVIAGLGNPGSEYAGTRHNAGFAIIDRLVKELPGEYQRRDKFSGELFEGRFRGRTMRLIKPMTFMNLSGKAVVSLMRKFQIEAEELLLIYDEVDLPLGRMRIRRGGGSAGHRGVESVINEVGSNQFARLRVGISGDKSRQVDHVLGKFSPEEEMIFEKVATSAVEASIMCIARGVTPAMNRFNALDLAVEEEESKKELKQSNKED